MNRHLRPVPTPRRPSSSRLLGPLLVLISVGYLFLDTIGTEPVLDLDRDELSVAWNQAAIEVGSPHLQIPELEWVSESTFAHSFTPTFTLAGRLDITRTGVAELALIGEVEGDGLEEILDGMEVVVATLLPELDAEQRRRLIESLLESAEPESTGTFDGAPLGVRFIVASTEDGARLGIGAAAG